MSIVGRGLGRGAAAILVTAGLGLSGSIAPPLPDEPMMYSGGPEARDTRRWRDDELFEIAAALIVSGALEGT